jgi:predicted transcriptional regulator of viral defense system
MAKLSVLSAIKKVGRGVFTTREIALLCQSSLSNANQALNCLVRQGVVLKIHRGIWGLEMGKQKLSQYSIIPFLFSQQRAYVSFVSALHLYGIIEQIPQSITLAAISHTRTIRTKLGTFFVHKISPVFFKGFDWYKQDGDFLIADPEKALIDCLYISVRKKRQFGYFPELNFPASFDFNKARKWAQLIPDFNIRSAVSEKLSKLANARSK